MRSLSAIFASSAATDAVRGRTRPMRAYTFALGEFERAADAVREPARTLGARRTGARARCG